MDYKTFRRKICDQIDRNTTEVDALMEGLAMIIRQSSTELDSVAVPTFGTFEPIKYPEQITTDLSTGKRMLIPPQIELTFRPGGMLLKRLRNE